VFAFVCPGTAKVKERTIYSSIRGSLVAHLNEILGEEKGIQKKLELDHFSEMNKEAIAYEFTNTSASTENLAGNRKFTKPRGPGRK
jgi:hypothetical protein